MISNKIIYFDEKFPNYYMDGSRDFQLLARLLTLVLNSAKVEADSLLYLNDAKLINDKLLPLLQTKVGFWTNKEFTNDELRFVCEAFDLLVRKKGSRDGIVGAIELFLKTIHVATDFNILIINKNNLGENLYEIQIGIEYFYHDYSLLLEILKYILPTGYIVTVYYYSKADVSNSDQLLEYSDFVRFATATNLESAKIMNGSFYKSSTKEWEELSENVNSESIQSIDMTRISSTNENLDQISIINFYARLRNNNHTITTTY